MAETDNTNWPTRRTVLEGGAATSLLLVAGVPVRAGGMMSTVSTTAPVPTTPVPTMPMTLKINAEERAVELDPRTTLLDALRNHLASPARKRVVTTDSAAPAPSW